MIERLAFFLIRRRKSVLWTTGLILVLAAAFGGGVAQFLSSGGYENPGSESAQTRQRLIHEFGLDTPNLILEVVSSETIVRARGEMAAPPTTAFTRGLETQAQLAKEPGVTQVIGYFTTRSPDLLSNDGHKALILARIQGNEEEVAKRIPDILKRYEVDEPDYKVGVGGFAAIFKQVNETITRDVAKAEIIAVPITFLALVLVFGGLVAAALPLVVGGTAILATYLFLRILVMFTDVSVYSLNITTAMGLGLGIDYALFIVTRYREQLRNNKTLSEALVITLDTAGRTVVFSSLTVAVSLSALLVFPLFFLRSFAYAGIVVVLSAMLGAVIVLPALLAILGPKVNAGKVFNRHPTEREHNGWYRIAQEVMARPVHVGMLAIVLLVALGVPFLDVRFGLPDDRVLPKSASTHQVMQDIREDFSQRDNDALTLIAPRAPRARSSAELVQLQTFTAQLSALDGVGSVESAVGTYVDGQRTAVPDQRNVQYSGESAVSFKIVPTVEAYSSEGKDLVHAIRATRPSFVTPDADVGLTGTSAQFVDVQEAVFDKLPLAFAIIALTTFVLLFLMTGSVVMPIKALLLNVLSLSAVFGSLVWIFQDGHLGSLIGGFQHIGFLDITTPVLLFCVAFGLSMDYEVFLLSRIKEEYDRTGDTREAVAYGLSKTGRIVTSAALLFSVVNLSFVTSQITFIKLFGIGLTIAVMMDATIIRGLLVPAFMRLMGDLNWWAPKWAHKLHDRFGIHEHS